MTIDLVPLSQFSDRYKQGWRLVHGYDLKAGDYTATMQSPGHESAPLHRSCTKCDGKHHALGLCFRHYRQQYAARGV